MAAELMAAIATFLQHADRKDAKTIAMLTPFVCRLALVVVPDVQTKVYEHIVAEKIGATVCKKLTGPDLLDKDGNPMEVKMSRAASKVNFAWPIPQGPNIAVRRGRLVQSVRQKGEAICCVIDENANLVREYRLKQEFLCQLFSRWQIHGSAQKVNLGSTWCKECERCPRMDRFEAASKKFPDLEDADWSALFAKMPPHSCS